MKKEKMLALFLLADIHVDGVWQLPNGYWPECDGYHEIRRENPWWLVRTKAGLIEIGWRKRVISINWKDTGLSVVVTEENVTKEWYMVHAWSYPKAIEYLGILSRLIDQAKGKENE